VVPVTFGHCEVACFNNTTTTSARLLLHDLVSSATPARENQKQNFLFENTRESQQKKKDPNLGQLQSRSLFSSYLLSFVLLFLFSRLQQHSAPPLGHALLFSLLSSSSSSLACSNAALLLQATPPPCWEPENGRARTAHARN